MCFANLSTLNQSTATSTPSQLAPPYHAHFSFLSVLRCLLEGPVVLPHCSAPQPARGPLTLHPLSSENLQTWLEDPL